MEPDVEVEDAPSRSPEGSDDELSKAPRNRSISMVRKRLSSKLSATNIVDGAVVRIQARAGFSERQVQELREIFGLFDLEGSGEVVPKVVRDAAAEVDLDKTNPEVWNMLASLDSEDPVDFEEFVALVTESLGDPFSKAGASRMMGLLGDDAARAGSIGPEDLKRITDDLGLSFGISELEELLEKAGADAENKISLDDFYSVMKTADSDEDADEE